MHGSSSIGAISGGILGYISGGTRGARVGYKLGYNAGKSSHSSSNMAGNKRRNSASHGHARPTVKIRKTMHKLGSRRIKRKQAMRKKVRSAKNGSSSRKNQQISQHNNVAGIKLKPIWIGKSKLPHKYKFKFQIVKQITQTGTQGDQDVILLPKVGTQYQLSGALSTTISEYDKWDTDPFKLNPWSNSMVANTVYPGPIPSVTQSDKLYYHGFKQHLSILNLENLPVDIQVIWCLCNQQTNDTPIGAWNACASTEEALTQPGWVAPANVAATTATSGYSGSNTYGSHPMEYKTWRKYWKILDTFAYSLQPGDQVNIHREIHYNKVLTRQWITSQTNVKLKGLTLIPMIIARSGLVGVGTGAGLAQAVSYGPTKLGIVDNEEHRFGGVPLGNNQATSRVYMGVIRNDVTAGDTFSHITDIDTVAPPAAA